MDVAMPDGTIVKNVPPGTTKAALMARVNAASSPVAPKAAGDTPEQSLDYLVDAVKRSHGEGALKTFLHGVVQGATANFGDEIVSGAKAVTQPLLHGGSDAATIGERYNQNVEAEREQQRINSRENPVADIAGNVAGVVAGPGKFVKGGKGVIGLIKQGAATGAIYGAGQGEGGLPQRAASAVEGAAIGAGTSALMGGALSAFNKVRPANVAANYVNKQYGSSPMAADSAQLSQDIGQTYTPGQATGSRSLLTIEGLVRRHPASADTMADFDSKQLDTSLRNLTGNLDRLHANPAGPEATGNLVSKSFNDVLGKAVGIRRSTADADFGKLDSLVASEKTRISDAAMAKYNADLAATKAENDAAIRQASEAARKGGHPFVAPALQSLPKPPTEADMLGVVAPKNLSSAIDEIVETFGAPGGGDASASLVSQAKNLKAGLPKNGEALTAKQTQRLLQIYGNAANGTGAVFKDLDTGQQRLIAGQLHRALIADVDAAADGGSHIGEIATALKAARDNYKSNSKAINELGDSVLGRLFGGDYAKAPERVALAMKNMKPSELRQSMDILNKADPATSQTVKRFLVEDAINTAGFNPQSGAPQPQVGGDNVFSAPKFLTAIRKSPVWNTFDPGERKGMEQAVRDLERVSFRNGTDGSPTAPLMAAMGLLSKPAGRVLGGAALGGGMAAVTGGDVKEGAFAGATAGGLGGMAIPKLAKVITTTQGQQALRTLRIAKPNSPAAMAATSVLIGLIGPKDAQEQKGSAQ